MDISLYICYADCWRSSFLEAADTSIRIQYLAQLHLSNNIWKGWGKRKRWADTHHKNSLSTGLLYVLRASGADVWKHSGLLPLKAGGSRVAEALTSETVVHGQQLDHATNPIRVNLGTLWPVLSCSPTPPCRAAGCLWQRCYPFPRLLQVLTTKMAAAHIPSAPCKGVIEHLSW